MFYVYFDSTGKKAITQSLSTLAEKIGYSPEYLCKLLRNKTIYKDSKKIILKFANSDLVKQKPRNMKGNKQALILAAAKLAAKNGYNVP